MEDFYIGWSHSDAMFCDYFDHCPLLISATPDNRHQLRRFKKQPNKLIVDSGSFFYVKQKQIPKLKDVFDIQKSIVKDAKEVKEIRLVHFDEPMLNKITLSDQYKAMEKTLYNAWEYIDLFYKNKFPNYIHPMGVIQGFDPPSIQFSARELKKMGYAKFGIGSMLSYNAKQQIDLIKHASDIVGTKNLHVFGVTGMLQIEEMINLQVASFDSTRPTMAAAYFQVFYSNPFRTFLLKGTEVKRKTEIIDDPLPCGCPVCLNSSQDILIKGPRPYMRLRSIHNYYHLTKTINEIKMKKGGFSHAVSNVLWT